MMIGFALGAVGLDQMTGQLRLTFGFESLLGGFDFLCVARLHRLLAGLIQNATRLQQCTHANEWFEIPRVSHFLARSIAGGVIGRRVIAQSITQCFDHRGAAAGARFV